ncbi:hypothetical protein TL16_g10484 [Triparma laevis f. inornata]|uniref:Uncharacterized protein n=1 Tax=Triparma laevis f. inornata TaxID=1714386 RepID=A0A9W7BHG5_9STRA|nr:hypothetical protein TL16_g10484 [Triparma laevis f. inornata]
MPPKKKKGASKKPKKEKKPSGPPVPPLHELWSLETLHAQFEEKCKEVEALKTDKRELESTINTLQTDHQVVYEKFGEEFSSQNDKINSLVEAARSSESLRLSSEISNQKRIKDLSQFAQSAQHTVTRISAEWKAKLVLLREAETAVVRNAQLEIENSKLNRSIIALKSELKKREKQLFVVSKAGMDSSSLDLLENYNFSTPTNQEIGEDEEEGVVGERKNQDISIALVPMILEAMLQFPSTPSIHASGLKILSLLTLTKLDTFLFQRFKGLVVCLDSIRREKRGDVLLSGVKLVWKCVTLNEESKGYIEKEGGIAMTLSIMRLSPHSQNRRLVSNSIRLLNYLCGEVDMEEFGSYDSLFDEKEDGGVKEFREGKLEDLFPRVAGKRDAEKKFMEDRKKLDLPKKKKKVILPGVKQKKIKAAISPSKRRSILMLGEEEEKESDVNPTMVKSSSLPLIGETVSVEPSISPVPNKHDVSLPTFNSTEVSSEEVARSNPPATDTLMIIKSLFRILWFCLKKCEEEDIRGIEIKKSRESKSRGFSISSKDPNMSSPGITGMNMRDRGLTKVSSMPTMTGGGGGGFGSNFGSLKRGKREDEESDSDDYGIIEEEEEEDSGEEEVGEWDGGGNVNDAGGMRRKRRRRTKGRGQKAQTKNEFCDQSYKKTARDVLVNLVLSIDSSPTDTISAVLSYKSVQKLLVSAFEILKTDSDAVSACCMLVRSGLKEKANERVKQVSKNTILTLLQLNSFTNT